MQNKRNESKTLCEDASSCSEDYLQRPSSIETSSNRFVYSETIRRVENVFSGSHSGAFFQIMDIFVSGYGKLTIDTDLLSVCFLYVEKIKF